MKATDRLRKALGDKLTKEAADAVVELLANHDDDALAPVLDALGAKTSPREKALAEIARRFPSKGGAA